MSTKKLKEELHTLIDKTENDEILNMIKEDLVAYQTKEKEFDDLSDLCDEDRIEMEELINEDPIKDTITYEEHKKNIAEWRLELLQKRDTITK